MSNEKVTTKLNKKKRKQESINIDPVLLENLNNTHIHYLPKAPSKYPKAKFVCKICPYHMDDADRAIKHSQDNNHKRNLNKLRNKNLLTYLPNPTKVQIEAINLCLENTLQQPIFISEDEYQRRIDLCLKMNEIAREIKPGNRLVICGSLLYRLSMVSVSDVNLYLDTDSKDQKDTEYLAQLEELSVLFKSKLNLKTEIKLERFNCGLFCKDKQGVLYHISTSNRLQHLTSELIRIYLKIDSRANDLAKLFRYFANKAFIDQIKDGLFPSEAFSILVIFYLQQLTVPILPNLHKLANIHFPKDLPEASVCRECVNGIHLNYVNDVSWIRKFWTPPDNKMSLAELWIGLLKFYLVDFNSCAYMVSIRCSEPALKSERNMVNRRLAIEDPFDIKRNILFRWNSTDVVDFLHDQLQGCYIYFAIPQLENGPAFREISFREISLSNMKSLANVTPIFSTDDKVEAKEMIEAEFRRLYTEENSFYNVTKWPAEMLVKSCLLKILNSFLNNKDDIKNLVSLLELKTKANAHYSIESYVKFKDYGIWLANCVLEEMCDYFDKTGSWSKPDIETKIAFDLIKKSTQNFINESLNITHNDDEDDEDETCDNEIEEMDHEFLEDEEIDLLDNNNDILNCIHDSDSWKLPIGSKQIYLNIKGNALSSDIQDEYNEDRIKNIKKEELVYSFNKITIHDKKLVFICTICNTKGHRKENCEHAIPRFEEFEDILESVDHAWLVKLKGVLSERCKSIVPNNDKTKSNEKIFDQISRIIKSLYSDARPQLFGSTLNGFITRASDLDICLEFDNQSDPISNEEVTKRLRSIGREIKKLNNARVDYILKAKVPIIKFYMKNNIQGDISINNSLGLQNTKMLKLYTEICEGVKLLGNLIKYVAKACEIGDASQGTLSSYAYMLMLIHFLQKRGILPVLQELYENERPTLIIDGWDAWYQSDMSIIYKLWGKKPNNKSFEYLWLEFFYYYAVEFNINKEVVTIRRSKPLFKIDKNWQSAYMAVEDPFNLSHNLCGSLSLENCRYILECFAHILKLHSNSDNLNRPDGAHSMLLEPSILRPNTGNGRLCFNCNKQGHFARDCLEKATKITPTKTNASPQSSLPSLPAPLQFKPSNVSSRFYLQSEVDNSVIPETAVNYNIPLKAFKSDVNEFSVCPFSIKFGDKTVIVPMLVGKNEVIEKKLNSLLKNGLNDNVCVFPIESVKNIVDPVKQVEVNYENNTPTNSNRKQTNNKNVIPNSIMPNKYNQQPMYNRNVMMQQNIPQRIAYEPSIRMMAPNHNIQQFMHAPFNNIPPNYQYQGDMRNFQNWNYYQDIDTNRHLGRHPTNNNHIPRGNRK